MGKTSIFLFIHLLVAGCSYAIQYCSGSYNGQYYCEYREGSPSSNIIINAPHGGDLQPPSIPDRTSGCLVDGACVWSHNCGTQSSSCVAKGFKDGWTKTIAIEVADEIEQLTGHKPHLIINNLKRSKMDGNREKNQACFGVAEAELAFDQYHAFIAKAKSDHFANKRGLFIDIHGQVHDHGLVELGYQVLSRRLDENDVVIRYSSLHYAGDHLPSGVTFDQILRGDKSIGWYLQIKGYPTLPSPAYPSPNGKKYFIGGYNTDKYGSKHGGMVDGVQVEVHSQYRTSNTAVRTGFSKALAESVLEYMNDAGY